MAERTVEAARTMRSEGAIENEAGSGELLDTAKVNSTATAGFGSDKVREAVPCQTTPFGVNEGVMEWMHPISHRI